jgi:diadenosine tetraphosphatase ApaH/serine/threonine PP2A family protein phosphatase
MAFVVGDHVQCGKKTGIVRFKGHAKGALGEWFGLELSSDDGLCDGLFLHRRYFTCAPKRGVFVRAAALRPLRTTISALSDVNPTSQTVSKILADVVRKWQWTNTKTLEDRAALLIQVRCANMMKRVKKRRRALWEQWNDLDEKEENDLLHATRMASIGDKATQSLKSNDAGGTNWKGVDDEGSSVGGDSDEENVANVKVHDTASVKASDALKLGPETVLTLDFATHMMDTFKHDTLLPRATVRELLSRVEPLLRSLNNVARIPVHSRICVVGDLHGQLDDLFSIFKLNGIPSARNSYLFNGDFVDRGQFSCEILLVLLTFKLLYPHTFHLNLGNHEARDITNRDGFEQECVSKYGAPIYDHCCRVFSCLPLCSVLNDQVFVIHGGLGWDEYTLGDLDAIDVCACVCVCMLVCVCVCVCVCACACLCFFAKKR